MTETADEHRSELRIYLFGAPRIERDGLGALAPTREAAAVLAYLLLHPGATRRVDLASLVAHHRPGSATDRAGRELSHTLGELCGIHPGLLVVKRDKVSLNRALSPWVDIEEFDRVLNTQAHSGGHDLNAVAKAVALYQDGLLPDLDEEDWLAPHRERYRLRVVAALLLLAHHSRSRGDYGHAVEYARQVLAHAPDNESAHQHLMMCYALSDNTAAALSQFEVFARALRERPGAGGAAAEPSAETLALHGWIRQAAREQNTQARASTNLPRPLTSFVGRETELAYVRHALSSISTKTGAPSRLVTLTGAGGTGKTRLALQAATELAPVLSAGVWWVELADLTDPALVPHTVARALGIQPAANQSPSDAIALHFQQRQALLVLDNCEHALPSCIPLVRQLLQRCGNLCILTTSREPLCILGETVILTPPLSLPSLANTLLAHELSESDSVRLFIERARSVQPDFALTDASAPTVAAICRRLDGIPLAIELAAAQLASMSLEQLAHRLHNRFEWLIDGNSAAPARQHTLRATFDWSYALLNDAECVLFRRLSVFSGGWTREAAEAVVADDGPDTQGDIAHTPLHRDSVAPLLQHLVAMSLVVVQWTHDEPRYRMLETIREYASVKLTEAGERRPLRDRHCRHFVELVRAHHDDLHGPDRLLWLDRFDAERDNFRAALSHAEAGADGHAGLTMASHLGHFWHERGYWSEGRNWLTVLLERQPATQPPLTRCRALQVAAVLAADLDDFSAAQDLAHRSIELAQGIEGGGSVLPRAYLTLAWALLPSNSPSAYEMIQRSIEASRSAGDDWSLAYAQSFAGALLPDPAAARDALELSVALFRRVGDTASVATPETLLGELLLREGDFVRARVHLESALVVHRRMVSRRWIADTLKHLGVAAEMAGDLDAARSYLEESRELWRSLGSRQRTADTLGALARVARLSGDLEQAGLLCGESVRLCIDLPDRSALLHAVGGAACHLVARGEYALAIRAFGAINAAVRSADIRIRPDEWRLFDQCINAARDAVGIDAYLTHYSEGSAWPLDEIGQRCIQWVGAGSSHA